MVDQISMLLLEQERACEGLDDFGPGSVQNESGAWTDHYVPGCIVLVEWAAATEYCEKS